MCYLDVTQYDRNEKKLLSIIFLILQLLKVELKFNRFWAYSAKTEGGGDLANYKSVDAHIWPFVFVSDTY